MAYVKLNPAVYPIFFYYVILITIGIIILIKMVSKYLERKTKPTLYMCIAITTATAGLVTATIGLFEMIITGFFMEIYRFSLPLAYSFLLITSIVLFLFTSLVTDNESIKKARVPVIIVGIIIIILLYLPSNFWGIPSEESQGKFSTRLIVTLLLVLYNIFIYLVLGRIYYKSRKGTEEPIAKFGFTLLFYSMICLVFFLIFVVADTLMITFFEHDGYSAFMYIAWSFVVVYFIFSYLSLIMPDWVKKRINKKK